MVIKYDMYDPNTKVNGNDIGKSKSNSSKADVKFTTLGIGWLYRMNANVKFMLYYDKVTNETSTYLTSYSKDIKDDVITLRMQYKF